MRVINRPETHTIRQSAAAMANDSAAAPAESRTKILSADEICGPWMSTTLSDVTAAIFTVPIKPVSVLSAFFACIRRARKVIFWFTPVENTSMSTDLNRFFCAMLLSACVAHAQIRIASLNIAKKHGPKMLREIESQPDLGKADVLLLQEVVDGPLSHVASEIASALGMKVIFAPAFQLNKQYAEGLAILSRYPLGPANVTRLPRNNLHFHTRVRIAVATTVETPMGRMRVINTHLDNRINAAAKRRQLAPLWKETEAFNGPTLIGGDFNTGNFRWVAHLLPLPGLQSLRAAVNGEMNEHGFTTPLGSGPPTFHLLRLKLDWIYLRGMTPAASGVSQIRFSDHNAVWVTVRVP
jgi:endonuclease/exonuclease/phosphatase family metal-dependent hydrolase